MSTSQRSPIPFHRRRMTVLMAALVIAGVFAPQLPAAASVREQHSSAEPGAERWVSRPPLQPPRFGLAVVGVRDQILAIGGVGQTGFFGLTQARSTLPPGDWSTESPLRIPRGNFAAGVLGETVYVAGGFSFGTPELDNVEASVEKRDPRSGRWTQVRPLPHPRAAAGGAGLGGKFYVAGGYVGDKLHITSSVLAYDPTQDVWRTVAPMIHDRARFRLVAADGYLYAIGGMNRRNASIATVERYDPRTDRWTATAAMAKARTVPCAVQTTVGGRQVLVVVGGSEYSAGFTFVTAHRTTEVFDPAAGRWHTLDALLPLARASHDCATESDGAVVAVGGSVLNIDGTITLATTSEALKIARTTSATTGRTTTESNG